MNIGYLITARLKSTRLPKKVMREVAGRPLLGHMIDRLKFAKRTNEIRLRTRLDDQVATATALAGRSGTVYQAMHEQAGQTCGEGADTKGRKS